MADFAKFASVFSNMDKAADDMYQAASAGQWNPPTGEYECLGTGFSARTWPDEANNQEVPVISLSFQILGASTGDTTQDAILANRPFEVPFFLKKNKKNDGSFGSDRFKAVVEKLFGTETTNPLAVDAKRVNDAFENTVWMVRSSRSKGYDGQDVELIDYRGPATAG